MAASHGLKSCYQFLSLDRLKHLPVRFVNCNGCISWDQKLLSVAPIIEKKCLPVRDADPVGHTSQSCGLLSDPPSQSDEAPSVRSAKCNGCISSGQTLLSVTPFTTKDASPRETCTMPRPYLMDRNAALSLSFH